jgi:hypothetical protein
MAIRSSRGYRMIARPDIDAIAVLARLLPRGAPSPLGRQARLLREADDDHHRGATAP